MARSLSPPSQLRSLHRSATSSFLLRDYPSTYHSLKQAFLILRSRPTTPSEDDLKRKLTILQISFWATVKKDKDDGGVSLDSLAEEDDEEGEAEEILNLSNEGVVKKLWFDLLDLFGGKEESGEEGEGEGEGERKGGLILPSRRAGDLHPSLATSLALAAMKLSEPKQAKAIAEAWFGSISEGLESSLLAEVEEQESKQLEGEGMMSSVASLGSEKNGKGLVKSWIKLWELLVLHVLPELGEWENAGDWCVAQKRENGGWLEDSRVESTLSQISTLQTQSLLAASTRSSREAAIASSSLSSLPSPSLPTSSTTTRKSKSKSRSSNNNKGKEREREREREREKDTSNSNDSSPGSSPGRSGRKKTLPVVNGGSGSGNGNGSGEKKVVPTTEEKATGFAALRSNLSSYLSTPSTSSTSPGGVATTSRAVAVERSVIGRLIESIRTDPLRLLSMIFVVIAAGSWIRRWRLNGGRVREGLKKGLMKVVETAKMGTKVTTL